MNTKSLPFTEEELESIIAIHPTPFHIYDEKGIIDNIRRFIKAFDWAPKFKEYFAVKATPNPYIMKLLQKEGVGADCSSLAELLLCEKIGLTGHDILFTSNDTPFCEYQKALELGALLNLDDITMLQYLVDNGVETFPDTMCFRYNPGSLKEGGNDIIGVPEEAKYGMTREQIFKAIAFAQKRGVLHFGIHTMVCSNELDVNGLVGTAKICFDLAVEIKNKLGVIIEFIDLGGGIGVAYRPEETPVDFNLLSKGIQHEWESTLKSNGMSDTTIAFECGRMVTGPFGYLVTTAIHKKDIYRHYIGLDACMANLMRPALYGSYHHITVVGKENAPLDHIYDITGSLCENNDKFAIQRTLPKIDIGDRIVIHDTGAHGHAMGFNYNGKLRSAELLLHDDKSVTEIRRAETYDDLFATLDFSHL